MLSWDSVQDVPQSDEFDAVVALLLHAGGLGATVVMRLAQTLDFFWGGWEQEVRHLNVHLQLNSTLPSWLVSTFRHSQRQELVLIGYGMSPRHGELIGQVMNPFSRVKRLVLLQNTLRDAGARGIAIGLERDTVIEELVLDRCQIGDDGAEALASVLAVNKTLRILQLEENSITDTGACALATVLASVNTSLRELLLGGNYIGPVGSASLEAITQCRVPLANRFSGQTPAVTIPKTVAFRYPPNEYRFTYGCWNLYGSRVPPPRAYCMTNPAEGHVEATAAPAAQTASKKRRKGRNCLT